MTRSEAQFRLQNANDALEGTQSQLRDCNKAVAAKDSELASARAQVEEMREALTETCGAIDMLLAKLQTAGVPCSEMDEVLLTVAREKVRAALHSNPRDAGGVTGEGL
jgi:chromosome segregation ATPase